MPTYDTEAVVLSRRNAREHDRFYSLYSKELGRIDVYGQGTRRLRSKLSPFLIPGNRIRLMGVRGKKVDRAAGCRLLDTIRDSDRLDQLLARQSVIRLVELSTRRDSSSNGLWEILVEVLNGIHESKTIDDCRALEVRFYLKILSASGYHFELKRCLHCDSEKITHFNPSGGVFCSEHSHSDFYRLSSQQLSDLWNLQENSVTSSLPENRYMKLKELLSPAFEYHFERSAAWADYRLAI